MADDLPYAGPERRKGPRRQSNERRTLIRYEPGLGGRRSGKDRRKNSPDIWKDRDF